MNFKFWAPYTSAVILGTIYIVGLFYSNMATGPLLKASPMLIFAFMALQAIKGQTRILIALAFLASATGDYFLAIDRQLYLKHALGAFLFTQVFYTCYFYKIRNWNPAKIFIPLFIFGLDGLVLGIFWQNLGPMLIPVGIYMLALSLMLTSALVTGNRILMTGALMFFIADALIGLNRFIHDFPHSTQIIVSIYFSGQLLLAWGLFKQQVKPEITPDIRHEKAQLKVYN